MIIQQEQLVWNKKSKKKAQSSKGVNEARIYSAESCRDYSSGSRTARFLQDTMTANILYTAIAGLAVLPLLLYLKYPYIWYDLRYAISAIQVGIRLNKYKNKKPFYSIVDCFLDKVARQPHKKFLLFEESSYTYIQADKESNRVARALSQHANLKEGDTVALFLGNQPLFVWFWLALAKLGCTAALLNYNVRSKSLLHCFSCCEAKALVVSAGEVSCACVHVKCVKYVGCSLVSVFFACC